MRGVVPTNTKYVLTRMPPARSLNDMCTTLQRVAYLITRFSRFIKAIQNIDVYSCGDQFIVEADLILPAVSDHLRPTFF